MLEERSHGDSVHSLLFTGVVKVAYLLIRKTPSKRQVYNVYLFIHYDII